MHEHAHWEADRFPGGNLLAKVRRLVHEGNVRRMVVRHDGRTVVELPVTVGVIAVVVAPVLAVAGVIAVAVGKATIDVEPFDGAATAAHEL